MKNAHRLIRPQYPQPQQGRAPRPSDWGIGMTVCIAAIASDQNIVAVSDHMLSMAGGSFSADSAALKERTIHPDWGALFSSDDVGAVPSLIGRIIESIGALAGPEWSKPVSAGDVARVLSESYQIERLQRAIELHLTPNGVTLQEFHQRGSKIFGATGAAILRERIEGHRLGCDLLVFGFDGPLSGPRSPHLFHVTDPGVVKDHDVARYWAIGSGSYSALSSLAARGHNVLCRTPETLYHVCEAKFSSESAFGVGKQTYVVIRNAQRRWLHASAVVGKMRTHWQQLGKPRPADVAAVAAEEWLRSGQWDNVLTEDKQPSADANQASGASSSATSSSIDHT